VESFGRPKVIVGIPAFNEGESIADIVAGALRHASTVVVIDDGSTDVTAFRATRAGAVVIRHPINRGKGAAVASLFAYAREHEAEILVLLDGDGQHNPDEIPAVIAPCLSREADVVVGSRFLSIKSDVPVHRYLGQRLFNFMTSIASGVRCSDSQSGFRAFNRHAFCRMRITETSFSVECEQQFECLVGKLRLAEVPITCNYRVPEKRSAYIQGIQVLHRLGAMAVRRRILQPPPPVPLSLPPVERTAEEGEPVVVMGAD
jgi:glycosyltransferase involved in cell wall biosynthesis